MVSSKPMKLIPLLVLLANAAFAEQVSISILSVLQPTEVNITLLHPDLAVVTNGTSRTILISKRAMKFSVQDLGDEQVAIDCAELCHLTIEVPGKITRSYEGNLRLNRTGSTINIVLYLHLDDLIGSIAASEMGEFRNPEALAAFAIVSRSFIHAGRRHPELNADLCDTTHCQVFQAFNVSREILQAVQRTSGLALTYRQMRFRAYYFRSCGGQTATFQQIWNQAAPDYPFFSVRCPCDTSWQARLDSSQLRVLTGFPVSRVVQNDQQIELASAGESVHYRLEEFRTAAGRAIGWNRIQSNSFTATQTGSDLLIRGKGIGHRVGFCQTGAFLLAEQGKSFQQILQHYFPNTEIRSIQ
jgi:SpoIID/LytB domain protein